MEIYFCKDCCYCCKPGDGYWCSKKQIEIRPNDDACSMFFTFAKGPWLDEFKKGLKNESE